MDLPASGLSDTDLSAVAANLSAATGGAAPHHAWRMLCELAAAAGGGSTGDGAGAGGGPDEAEAVADGEARVLAALEAAMALAPRDPLEGMLVTQMTAVNAAAMRCLVRAAECAEYPKIEALYLREAARLLHLFQRQAETLDRRARQFGPPKDAGETAAAGDAGDAAKAAPDGAEVLEKFLADLRARMQARKEREGVEGEGDAGDGGGEAGTGTCGERGANTGPPG